MCQNKYAQSNRKDKQLKYSYGITEAQFDCLAEKQGHKCKICNEHVANLVVDHDHKTGKIRGLICHSCNKGLGFFKDNVNNLLNAIKYLTN
jgi:N12 class adenine-specific DNA methylase